MKITKIIPQRNNSRLNIYIDDDFVFGISSFIASKYKLTVGNSINKTDLKEIYTDDTYEYLKHRLLAFISTRPRSTYEVKTKVNQILKSIGEKTLTNNNQESSFYKVLFFTSKDKKNLEEKVVLFLEKYNYLDDYAFANWVCEQRLNQGKGIYYIRQDLQRKGVEKHIIKDTLAQLDSTNAINSSLERALKKYSKETNSYKKKQKIYRFLLSKGFSYDQINALDI